MISYTDIENAKTFLANMKGAEFTNECISVAGGTFYTDEIASVIKLLQVGLAAVEAVNKTK